MAYRNILWIKLEKRLLNDSRFFTLSEESQLIYLKLLMLSAETSNKIPKKTEILRTYLRTEMSDEKIESCLKEIQKHYPKFKNKTENKGEFYYFGEWDYKHNWIKKSNSPATPQQLPSNRKGTVDKIRLDKKRKEESNFVFPYKNLTKLKDKLKW